MDIEKTANTMSGLIPQLFFDLIARILPGPIIIASILIASYSGLDNLHKAIMGGMDFISHSQFFYTMLSIFVCYIVSIICYGLWYLFINTNRFIFKESSMSKFVEVTDIGRIFSLRHDFIKLHAPIAGSRITKLKAEIHMSGSLIIGFVICSIISLINQSHNPYNYHFLIFTICMLGSSGSYLHYCQRLKRAVESYSELLEFKASFRLTSQSFGALKNENIPSEILDILKPLGNREFDNEKEFLYAVKELIKQKPIKQKRIIKYMMVMLEYAEFKMQKQEDKTRSIGVP